MNQKRAKAVRKMAQHIAKGKDLPEVAYKTMSYGFNQAQVTVAADTVKGQYRALKKALAQHY